MNLFAGLKTLLSKFIVRYIKREVYLRIKIFIKEE